MNHILEYKSPKELRRARTKSTQYRSQTAVGLVLSYSRFSTNNQKETSIERQQQGHIELAERLKITQKMHFFEDRGVSGTKFDRPGLNALLDEIRAHPGSVLFVEDFDRMCRNDVVFHRVAADLIENECTVVDRQGVVPPQLINHKGTMASEAFKLLRARCAYERFRFMLHGKYMSAPALGYRKVKKGEIAVDEPSAVIVRDIYDKFVNQKFSIGAICRDLYERGVPAPMGGEVWFPTTVKYILSNKIYIGLTEYDAIEMELRVMDDEWRGRLALAA